ncbi:MAG TPA: hypothetical protein ENK82_03720 [Campylobacterales bacterium]|nr:hypothetical protein [Campylobacterales bacterium]
MRKLTTISFSLVVSLLLIGCGGSGTGNKNATANDENGTASNIPYLKANHANYTEHGTTQIPAPVKDATTKSISWTITATTEESASKLAEHINYMDAKLQEGKNPRAFDKLFLMEAYMKFNKYYTTSVERSATNVVVSKKANTDCAYEVISAHSDVVNGDFFARGDTSKDYSNIAEGILASQACESVRVEVTNYISERQKDRK